MFGKLVSNIFNRKINHLSLQMPQVLLKMQQLSPSHDLSIDLEQGFDRLLGFSHMLDLTDIKLK